MTSFTRDKGKNPVYLFLTLLNCKNLCFKVTVLALKAQTSDSYHFTLPNAYGC